MAADAKRTAAVAAVLLLATGTAAQAQQQQTQAQVAPAMPARSGSVVVKVPDFDQARKRVIDVAVAQGGAVLDSRTEVTDKGRKHGWVRLRLSADRLEDFLPAARSVGRVAAERVGTAEQAAEYEELARRAGRLEQHQGRLDALLKSSRRLRGSDILYVQERLFRAGVDQSLLEQRRLDLARRSETATVTVSLFEPPPAPVPDSARRIDLGAWYASARTLARHKLERTLARATTGAAYAAVYAPLWAPALIAGLFALRLLWVWSRALRARAWSRLAPAVAAAAVSAAAALASRLSPGRRGGGDAAPSVAPPATP
jgi:primosomal protein N'